MNNRITIFLSHSHKDEEKVRKIRDVLEILDCEPLIFFLKCLDDENEELEDFIKREIRARNVFLYCKSANSENSPWVQKELEYIRSIDSSRLYELDIEKDFSRSLISFLQTLTAILKRNRVFLTSSGCDSAVANRIIAHLQASGYNVFRSEDKDISASSNWEAEIKKNLTEAVTEGIYIFLASERSLQSPWCLEELHFAYHLYHLPTNEKKLIVPIMLGSEFQANPSFIPDEIKKFCWYLLPATPSDRELDELIRRLNKISR